MTNNLRIYLWIALARGAVPQLPGLDGRLRPQAPARHCELPPPRAPSRPTISAHEVPRSPADGRHTSTAPRLAHAPPTAAPATTAAPAEAARSRDQRPSCTSDTDVLDLDISTRGGTIQRADLPKYEKVKGDPTPVRLEKSTTR